MRSLLLATTALVLAAPAYAADMATKMPVKAPPMPAAAPFSWTACYLGGHVGAGWGRAKIGDPTNFVGSGTGFSRRPAPASTSIRAPARSAARNWAATTSSPTTG